ncbi:MAG TPA: hypothetical protein VFT04_00710, partial [Gemmatimonadales bacterium]|nr:hypothetical protein [Gemmatimonadales bacterium]
SGSCVSREDGGHSVPAGAALPETGWAVGLESVGPISFGMSLADAEAAAGASLAGRPADACAFVRLPGMPLGTQLMTERGRIVRADVTDGDTSTDRGARLGMTEEEVQALYDHTLEVRPHKYDSAGRYLVLVPDGAADSLRLVFETDGRAITRFRAGILPAVEYVEGCG